MPILTLPPPEKFSTEEREYSQRNLGREEEIERGSACGEV